MKKDTKKVVRRYRFKVGDRVVFTKEYLEMFKVRNVVREITEVKDTRHIKGSTGQWLKVSGKNVNDFIDRAWFEKTEKPFNRGGFKKGGTAWNKGMKKSKTIHAQVNAESPKGMVFGDSPSGEVFKSFVLGEGAYGLIKVLNPKWAWWKFWLRKFIYRKAN